MALKNSLKEFVAADVPLTSSNLIEASAGTGKTYSIAILVLRLLLEKKFSIKQILMVTFTKAAVAELEERIRLFVRTALVYANNGTIEDATIIKLVDRAIGQSGQEAVIELLKEAKLLLDETSVMTIHSFCQQSLNEFAFETNQLFGSETLQDTSSLIQEEVNKFWRERITTLDPQLLGFLLKEKLEFAGKPKLSREILCQFVSQYLNGQRYIDYNPQTLYSFTLNEQKEALAKFLAIDEAEASYWEELIQEISESQIEITARCESNAYARKNLLAKVGNPEEFIQAFMVKKIPAYISTVFPDWLEKIQAAEQFQTERAALGMDVLNKIYCMLIQYAIKNINSYKEQNSVLTFNDMIVQLHKAVTKPGNEKLIEEFQKKYKAVFIDEFQDTDRLQYEIFKTAFGKGVTQEDEPILFYIGDPKQSIYAWRQADLNTFFEATHEVANRYGMNQNYRSSENFIRAMNMFFLPTDNFDTFNFGFEKDAIRYINVDSPQPNHKGVLCNGQEEEVAITIFENKLADDLYQTVCAQIIQLLENESFQIKKNGEKRRIKPSDIGVLVRTKGQGRKIKMHLAKYGIPAITIDDSKVLQTLEARYVYYLLNAFLESNPSNINKALLSPLTGYTRLEILQLDQDLEIKKFKEYGLSWQNTGIYATLMKFIVDFDVKNNLLTSLSGKGERSITNLYQLAEILHKVQESKSFSQLELIHWLKRGIEGMKLEGDEYEQRVESDMEAVEIVTIHKSKGLEYNIVFAPFLDLKSESKHNFYSFKEGGSGEYLFGISGNLTDENRILVEQQLEQENRRLLYVAITRAVYKCYISRYTHYSSNTSLIPFVAAVKENPDAPELISFSAPPEIKKGYRYSKNRNAAISEPAIAENFELNEKNWQKLSYSRLAQKAIYTPKSNTLADLTDYEYFIFKQLKKGNITGNLLHHIFENIDFSSDQLWEKHIHAALTRFMPKQLDNYQEPLMQLATEVLNTQINIGDKAFKLSEVPKEKRLNELEFDFNVPIFETRYLNSLSRAERHFTVNSFGELEGIMNGKIDLLFEHEGMFYILDWKSNFLGDSIDQYGEHYLNAAMADNNYHFQYLIYTVAVKKYLSHRLPDFDYENHFGGVIYLFIRGVRRDKSSGIFISKPALSEIEELEKVLSYAHK